MSSNLFKSQGLSILILNYYGYLHEAIILLNTFSKSTRLLYKSQKALFRKHLYKKIIRVNCDYLRYDKEFMKYYKMNVEVWDNRQMKDFLNLVKLLRGREIERNYNFYKEPRGFQRCIEKFNEKQTLKVIRTLKKSLYTDENGVIAGNLLIAEERLKKIQKLEFIETYLDIERINILSSSLSINLSKLKTAIPLLSSSPFTTLFFPPDYHPNNSSSILKTKEIRFATEEEIDLKSHGLTVAKIYRKFRIFYSQNGFHLICRVKASAKEINFIMNGEIPDVYLLMNARLQNKFLKATEILEFSSESQDFPFSAQLWGEFFKELLFTHEIPLGKKINEIRLRVTNTIPLIAFLSCIKKYNSEISSSYLQLEYLTFEFRTSLLQSPTGIKIIPENVGRVWSNLDGKRVTDLGDTFTVVVRYGEQDICYTLYCAKGSQLVHNKTTLKFPDSRTLKTLKISKIHDFAVTTKSPKFLA